MDQDLASLLDRADELLEDLRAEYESCLRAASISRRARNLTSEVLEKLRNSLDQAVMKAWNLYVRPGFPAHEQAQVGTRVYFPCSKDLHSFRSTLGQAKMQDLDRIHRPLYDFLVNRQPFSSPDNQWLQVLAEIVRQKHVRLVPQTRIETRRVKVSRKGMSVSWPENHVQISPGVRILGAPIDPKTGQGAPTPGVDVKREIWVRFVIDGYGIDALRFCKEACQKTRSLLEDMMKLL